MDLRNLKIKLIFESNVTNELKKTNSEVDALKAKFEPLLQKLPPDLAKTASEAGKMNDQLRKADGTLEKLQNRKPPKLHPPEIDKSIAAMAELAKATGHSEKTLQKMIDAAKKDLHLEEQFKKAASAVGLTDKEVDKLNNKLKSAEASTANFANIFKGLAALGVTAAAFGFANKAIDESNRAENALIGFNTVVKNTLGAGKLDETTQGVQKLFQKLGGSMDMSSIQMSVKNLLNSGFSASQALELVEKNAYMASVNRQGQFKTISEAVQVYTEGIKNNNAMLTDSTGISENLSVTLKKKGLSMDDLNNSTKRALVLQTIYDSHTKEASAYQGAYTQQMAGYQGQVLKANSAMSKILETSGNFIKLGLTPLLAMASPVLGFFSDSERGAGRTSLALGILATAIGVGLVSATWSWVAALNAVAIAKMFAFGEIIAIALGIAAALTAVYLVFEDIFVFLENGPEASNTFFGDMLKWLGLSDKEMQALSDGFKQFKVVMGEAWEKMKAFADSPAGQFLWKMVKWVGIAIAAIALLPVVIIAGFALMTAYIIAKWDMIWDFLKKAAILGGKMILAFMFPLAGLYLFKDEIFAVFTWLWNLFKSTDIGKFFIDQFMSLKNALAPSLSGIFESAKAAFLSMIPSDMLNAMIDSINWVLEKLNEFSSGTVAKALGMEPLNLQMIAHVQARAMGGPIEAGVPYIVGEKGPELRTFSQPGSIVPNDKLNQYQPAASGGGSVNISVNANVIASDAKDVSLNLFDKLQDVIDVNRNIIKLKLGMAV